MTVGARSQPSSRASSPSRQFAYAGCCALAILSAPAAGDGSASSPAVGVPAASFAAAIVRAEAALGADERQIAESELRTALLEGWLLLGSLAIEAGDLDRAGEAFEMAGEVAVETRRALTLLALTRLEQGREDEALGLLRKLVVERPDDLAARRLFARALSAAGRHDEALSELEQLQALAPDDLENRFLLAMAQLRRDRIDAAQPHLDHLVQERPIPQTHVLIGRVLRDFGFYPEARAALSRALDMDPEVARAHYYLGTLDLLDQGRGMLAEAMEHFAAELRISPEDPSSNLYLGIGLVEDRRHDEAIPHLEAAARGGAPERDTFQFLGRSYLALGRHEEAIGAFRRALDLASEAAQEAPPGVQLDLGESQVASLHYQLALALRRAGKEAEAAPHFEASKRSSATVARNSREILRRYLESETSTAKPASTSLFGDSPLSQLDPEARERLEREVVQNVARSYFNLGVLRLQKRQHARAAALFEQAAGLDSNFPGLQHSLGVARFNAGQFGQATGPLAAALAGDPASAELRRMLALAALNSGDPEQAAELLRDDPGRAGDRALEYAYSVALVRSGRLDDATRSMTELLSDNRDWPELNVVLAQAHAQQDDYSRAIHFAEHALELDAGVAEAHRTLGDIYLRQGRLDAAERELRAELASHPDDAQARYTLAVVLDLSGKAGEAGLEVREVLSHRPQMADARYLLGKILLAEGRPQEALEQLRTASASAPTDANVRYQIGRALQALGRTDEAREAFAEFRRLKSGQQPAGEPPDEPQEPQEPQEPGSHEENR